MENKLINYANLNDAVIIEIQYIYPGYDDESIQRKVRVVVDCINASQNWERIALYFEGVSSFSLKEGKSTNQIIDEIKIQALPSSEDNYVFDFSQGEFVDGKYISDFYLVFSDMSVSTIKHL